MLKTLFASAAVFVVAAGPALAQVVPSEPATPAERAQVRRDWNEMAREWEQRQRRGYVAPQGSVVPSAGGIGSGASPTPSRGASPLAARSPVPSIIAGQDYQLPPLQTPEPPGSGGGALPIPSGGASPLAARSPVPSIIAGQDYQLPPLQTPEPPGSGGGALPIPSGGASPLAARSPVPSIIAGQDYQLPPLQTPEPPGSRGGALPIPSRGASPTPSGDPSAIPPPPVYAPGPGVSGIQPVGRQTRRPTRGTAQAAALPRTASPSPSAPVMRDSIPLPPSIYPPSAVPPPPTVLLPPALAAAPLPSPLPAAAPPPPAAAGAPPAPAPLTPSPIPGASPPPPASISPPDPAAAGPSSPPPAVAPPPPQQIAAAPPVAIAAGSSIARIDFASDGTDLSENGKRALDRVVAELQRDQNARLQLVAYATGGSGDDGGSVARRVSLSRALAVRSYLTEQGVSATRMDMRALGSRSTDGSAASDRVDVLRVRR